MKIARNVGFSGRYDEWNPPFPAPSLRELSSECETEGVSSVGSSGPMVCEPDRIGSEIFERLRSSKYTSHNINHPPAVEISSGRVIFVGSAWGYILPFNRVLAKIRGFGRFSSPLRRAGSIHRTTLPSAVGRGEFWGVSSLRRCGRGTSPGCPCRRRRR